MKDTQTHHFWGEPGLAVDSLPAAPLPQQRRRVHVIYIVYHRSVDAALACSR